MPRIAVTPTCARSTATTPPANASTTLSARSCRTSLPRAVCSPLLAELSIYTLVFCLNAAARRSRLYWLTELGTLCQRRLYAAEGSSPPEHLLPSLDWALYGRMCFSHRAPVIRTLNEPLQPAAIKRRARAWQPQLRISANNVRDVIRLLAAWGVVRPVQVRRKVHLRYELTDTGKAIQQLLDRAEVPL